MKNSKSQITFSQRRKWVKGRQGLLRQGNSQDYLMNCLLLLAVLQVALFSIQSAMSADNVKS